MPASSSSPASVSSWPTRPAASSRPSASRQDLYGKDELFWGVRAVLEELARRRPLVVVFDDIHWAEPTFLDLIEDILDASLGVPLLLVCAARHELLEDRPSFAAGRRTASQIDLAELSRTESGRVVRNLLGEASLPKPLERRILGLAEGNPLFIEQMLSMLIDDGRLREQAGRWVFSGAADVVSVPGNVSSLLGARLDRLGADRAEGGGVGLGDRPGVLQRVRYRCSCRRAWPRPTSSPRSPRCAANSSSAGRSRAKPTTSTSAISWSATRHMPACSSARGPGCTNASPPGSPTRSGPGSPSTKRSLGYHLEQSFRYRSELGPVDDNGRRLGAEASRRLSSAGRRALVRGDMPAAANLLQRAAALLGEKDPARALLLLDAGEAAVDIGELEQAESMLTEAVGPGAVRRRDRDRPGGGTRPPAVALHDRRPRRTAEHRAAGEHGRARGAGDPRARGDGSTTALWCGPSACSPPCTGRRAASPTRPPPRSAPSGMRPPPAMR